jgi:hypothetical protein
VDQPVTALQSLLDLSVVGNVSLEKDQTRPFVRLGRRHLVNANEAVPLGQSCFNDSPPNPAAASSDCNSHF